MQWSKQQSNLEGEGEATKEEVVPHTHRKVSRKVGCHREAEKERERGSIVLPQRKTEYVPIRMVK